MTVTADSNVQIDNVQVDFQDAVSRLRKAERVHQQVAARYVQAVTSSDPNAIHEARREMKTSVSWVRFSRNTHTRATRKLAQIRLVESFR